MVLLDAVLDPHPLQIPGGKGPHKDYAPIPLLTVAKRVLRSPALLDSSSSKIVRPEADSWSALQLGVRT